MWGWLLLRCFRRPSLFVAHSIEGRLLAAKKAFLRFKEGVSFMWRRRLFHVKKASLCLQKGVRSFKGRALLVCCCSFFPLFLWLRFIVRCRFFVHFLSLPCVWGYRSPPILLIAYLVYNSSAKCFVLSRIALSRFVFLMFAFSPPLPSCHSVSSIFVYLVLNFREASFGIFPTNILLFFLSIFSNSFYPF